MAYDIHLNNKEFTPNQIEMTIEPLLACSNCCKASDNIQLTAIVYYYMIKFAN